MARNVKLKVESEKLRVDRADVASENGLPKGWVEKTLGEVLTLNYGKSLPQAMRDQSGVYHVMGSNGAVDFHSQFLIEGPAIIVGRKGGAGEVTLEKGNCWPIDTTYYVSLHSKDDLLFVYYLLKSLSLKHLDKSTAIPGLNRDDAYALKVKVPPLPVQQKIVAKIEELFSDLDAGVESLKKAQEQLKVYRQSVLKAAFEGKLTAEWRTKQKKLPTALELLATIQAERQAHYEAKLKEWKTATTKWEKGGKVGKKPSKPNVPEEMVPLTKDELKDLPNLPEGWAWCRYGEICSLIRNGISQKPSGSSGSKIFRISAVRPMAFDMNDYRFIESGEEQFPEFILDKGDIVFTRYNGSRQYVGVCAEYKSDERFLYPDKLIRTRIIDSNLLVRSFYEKVVNYGASRKFIENRIRTTAGQSGISGEDVRQVPIPVPSYWEQALIHQQLEERLTALNNIEKQTQEALGRSMSLRQSILKRAFEGKLV